MTTTSRAFTPWPTVWTRALRSSQEIARHNAREAARVLAERRRERLEAESLFDAN
jgi:hypothetical protein